MSHNFILRSIDLQLFAEGGSSASAAGAEGSGTGAEGVTTADGMPATSARAKKNPLADVRYGIQENAEDAQVADAQNTAGQVSAEERAAKFEALIKGEYKDLYDAKMQDTIQKRLKGTKDTVDKYNALAPTLETLAKKYGVDPTDIDALNHAIDEDNTFFEDEALEKGISVEQLKEIRKIERENADLKKQMREQSVRENADRIYAGWLEQSDALKQIYPNFDLDAEIKNPRFVDLLKNNVDVRTAYEVLHKDSIISGAMRFAADTVQKKLANNIIAGGNRPSENGIGQTSPAVVKNDVSQLSRADREEIIRRVARGEKIRF